ncbi:unnamed protein product [Rotaria sp. Silwood2]|nr:unnamed protein product [Rotaria sp. Silwood2]
MSVDCFQQPPRRNRRSFQHAEQYRNQAPIIINKYENNRYRSSSRSNKFTGIVLSDSMCKYVRADKVSSQGIQVRISFESGCDCTRMLNYLEQQSIEKNFILQSNSILFSLCINDVANLGPNLAIEHCRLLIQRTRQLFPRLKSIGWLALSPRHKPSKLYNSSEIDKKNKEFNQLLKNLSNEMNFQIINANLQKQHMHEDGLHPSIQSGRILIERAIKKWFSKQKDTFSSSNVDNFDKRNNLAQNNFNHRNHNNQQKQQQHRYRYQYKQYYHKQQYQQQQQHNYQIDINNKNVYQPLSLSKKRKQQQQQQQQKQKFPQETQYQSSKVLINHYPHFIRHKEEFFRKVSIPIELENYKEKIFQLSNMHYQTEYFKLEGEKWKIYKISAMSKDNNSKSNKDHEELMETIIIDDNNNNNNNSIPISRPSPNGLAGPPAPLDFSEYSELFDDWLPEPIPGQKRKLGHRRDDPPTPPSPRQPPPIIPRKTLPPRDVNIPLTGGSVHGSPFSNDRKHQEKEQRSFNVLLPLEKQESNNEERQTTIANIARESSMIISPIKSSTPEIKERSPSFIPKNGIRATTTTTTIHTSFECKIIPIECRYFFKKLKQKYTFENIEAHQKFLEKQYRSLEDERESKLKLFFPRRKTSSSNFSRKKYCRESS